MNKYTYIYIKICIFYKIDVLKFKDMYKYKKVCILFFDRDRW